MSAAGARTRRRCAARAIANEQGIALLAVLGIVLAILPLAAAVAVETHLDILMQRNVRSGTEAFYTAEAGLAHALAELGPSASLRTLLRGPDGLASTPDDGGFPFRLAAPTAFAAPPAGYEVFAEPGPGSSVRVLSRGHSGHAAVRDVEILVAPAADPFTPGALYLASAEVDIDLGSHGFLISGAPQLQTDSAAIAGIAVPSASAAAVLRTSVEPAAAVSGAGESPSIIASSPIDLTTYPNGLAARADAVLQSPADTAEALTLGTASAPQLTVVGNDWAVAGGISGCGILLVRGDLEITGQLQYRGLVIVEGNLDLTSSGDLRIEGTLWSSAERLRLGGVGFVRYEPAILKNVDGAISEALLHLPVVVAWREVS